MRILSSKVVVVNISQFVLMLCGSSILISPPIAIGQSTSKYENVPYSDMSIFPVLPVDLFFGDSRIPNCLVGLDVNSDMSVLSRKIAAKLLPESPAMNDDESGVLTIRNGFVSTDLNQLSISSVKIVNDPLGTIDGALGRDLLGASIIRLDPERRMITVSNLVSGDRLVEPLGKTNPRCKIPVVIGDSPLDFELSLQAHVALILSESTFLTLYSHEPPMVEVLDVSTLGTRPKIIRVLSPTINGFKFDTLYGIVDGSTDKVGMLAMNAFRLEVNCLDGTVKMERNEFSSFADHSFCDGLRLEILKDDSELNGRAILVNRVLQSTLAEKHGFKVGDRIVRIGKISGQSLKTEFGKIGDVLSLPRNEPLEFEVIRGNERMLFQLPSDKD